MVKTIFLLLTPSPFQNHEIYNTRNKEVLLKLLVKQISQHHNRHRETKLHQKAEIQIHPHANSHR